MTSKTASRVGSEEDYTPFVCSICGGWLYSNPDAICTYTDNVDLDVKPMSFNICHECSPGFQDLLELITKGAIGLDTLTKSVQSKEAKA